MHRSGALSLRTKTDRSHSTGRSCRGRGHSVWHYGFPLLHNALCTGPGDIVSSAGRGAPFKTSVAGWNCGRYLPQLLLRLRCRGTDSVHRGLPSILARGGAVCRRLPSVDRSYGDLSMALLRLAIPNGHGSEHPLHGEGLPFRGLTTAFARSAVRHLDLTVPGAFFRIAGSPVCGDWPCHHGAT